VIVECVSFDVLLIEAMTAIIQMLNFDQRMTPVEVKITSENPRMTSSREIIVAASKKFKSVTKSCRAYNGVTRLELRGDVSLDDLSVAHVVLSSKSGWKGASDGSENVSAEQTADPQQNASSGQEAQGRTLETGGKAEQMQDLERLLSAARSDRAIGVVLLWKDTQDNGYLSNWSKSPFVLDGVAYNCVEQWIMSSKARACGDESTREQIMRIANPSRQKALGRSLDKKAVDRCWKLKQKWENQLRGVRAKFQQNEELAFRLLQTGQKPIAEASPSDQIYGIGLAPSNALAQDPANWKGLNLLGKALMQVRDELRTHLLGGGELSTFDIYVELASTDIDLDGQHNDMFPSESSGESSEETRTRFALE